MSPLLSKFSALLCVYVVSHVLTTKDSELFITRFTQPISMLIVIRRQTRLQEPFDQGSTTTDEDLTVLYQNLEGNCTFRSSTHIL